MANKRHGSLLTFWRFTNRIIIIIIIITHKARSTPATMSKQLATLLPVAVLGNNVEATFDFVERTKFQRKTRSTLLPFLATMSNVASTLLLKKRQRCRSNVRLCRSNIGHCSIRQFCFDIVAGVDRVSDTVNYVIPVKRTPFVVDGFGSESVSRCSTVCITRRLDPCRPSANPCPAF